MEVLLVDANPELVEVGVGVRRGEGKGAADEEFCDLGDGGGEGGCVVGEEVVSRAASDGELLHGGGGVGEADYEGGDAQGVEIFESGDDVGDVGGAPVGVTVWLSVGDEEDGFAALVVEGVGGVGGAGVVEDVEEGGASGCASGRGERLVGGEDLGSRVVVDVGDVGDAAGFAGDREGAEAEADVRSDLIEDLVESLDGDVPTALAGGRITGAVDSPGHGAGDVESHVDIGFEALEFGKFVCADRYIAGDGRAGVTHDDAAVVDGVTGGGFLQWVVVVWAVIAGISDAVTGGVSLVGVEEAGAVIEGVGDTVTRGVGLDIEVEDTGCACIAHGDAAIVDGVVWAGGLVGVHREGAVVAGISDAVSVAVELVWVIVKGTIVVLIGDAVAGFITPRVELVAAFVGVSARGVLVSRVRSLVLIWVGLV